MKYIVASSVGTDDVYQADGTVRLHVPGGAGFYALCGLRVFTDDALILSGVGPSYFSMHGDWYRYNGLAMEGLEERCADSITTIDYRSQDDRTDSPSNGLWEFRKRDPSIADVQSACGPDTRGIYTFRHYDPEFFEGLFELRKQYGCRILWEVSEDAMTEENREGIEKLIQQVDIFSVNRHELCLLYGTDDEEEAYARLRKINRNIAFVRRGGSGSAVFVGGEKEVYTKPCTLHTVVDTTGCGNSSSGAFLYGLCEGHTPVEAANYGAVAASYILAQFGPPMFFTKEMEKEALEEVRRMNRGEEK